jgi:hypothetical protein
MSPSRRRNDRDPLNQPVDTPASEPTPTGNVLKLVERPAPPTHEEIARRAYQLFEKRAREPGHDWEDWFRAEREL